MKKNFLVVLTLVSIMLSCTNQESNEEKGIISIIPEPLQLEQGNGHFTINEKTSISIPKDETVKEVADYLASYLSNAAGYQNAVEYLGADKNNISFELVEDEKLGDEGYLLSVTPKHIRIKATNSKGFFYGVQTILQLLPTNIYKAAPASSTIWKIPVCEIFDKPRFEWRGMHLDVGRHFFPVDFIKKYIDIIAMHKMNTFHWHLTEDQGWRIEIKKYPELTSISSKRKETIVEKNFDPYVGDGIPYEGFYTQEEVKEIVEYARLRQIKVVPEIEMPGHSVAVLAAYPELGCTGGPYEVSTIWGVRSDVFCAGNDDVFVFLENVLTEVMELFPSNYIHIGGDESPKERWEECEKCQARIKAEELKNEHELQSYFIKRIESFLSANGRNLIGWDEILEGGLAPNAAVMSWRGMQGGIDAAEQGHDVVMSPGTHCYFDHYQANPDYEQLAIGGFTPLEKVYAFEPIPEGLSADKEKHILGAQGNVWTEYMKTSANVEYMAVPRIAALSEVVWSPVESRDWTGFQSRLQDQFIRYDNFGINYSNGSCRVKILPVMNNDSYEISLESEQLNAIIYYSIDGTDPSPESTVYSKPFEINKSTKIKAGIFVNGHLKENVSEKEIVFHKGLGNIGTLKIDPNNKYYGSGAASLSDGLLGTENNRSEYWIGFEGDDMIFEIDLEKEQIITKVAVNFLQNTGSWILMPEEVIFEILSKEKKSVYKEVLVPEATLEVKGTIVEELKTMTNLNGQYIRVHAVNYKELPEWHKSAGSKSWLFVDEVVIK